VCRMKDVRKACAAVTGRHHFFSASAKPCGPAAHHLTPPRRASTIALSDGVPSKRGPTALQLSPSRTGPAAGVPVDIPLALPADRTGYANVPLAGRCKCKPKNNNHTSSVTPPVPVPRPTLVSPDKLHVMQQRFRIQVQMQDDGRLVI